MLSELKNAFYVIPAKAGIPGKAKLKYSYQKEDNRIEFLQGDSNKVEAIFPKEKISEIVHPIL
ncbi:hypothetical protein RAT170B_0129 [Rickettsia argasii T170-B]|uniref:Uncharacterized protein n=1 Tax=Rickettsia argasii T170-B TaxID=1268837 RepID=A0A0F3RFV3_9RICK|nr:hypothetical protein RAT170B_0129 [Rickettsia argasii T170-B]